MDRAILRYGYLAAALCAALIVIPAGGCQSLLTTLVYFTRGTDVPAEFKGLQDKKVVVVCRPLIDLKFRDSGAARDLARELSRLLKENDRKIQVVDSRQVAEWIDENGDWDEFAELGDAVGAEIVVGIDLHDFSIHESQVLYQGKATVSVSVYDCQDPDEPVFQRELKQTVYPPNSVIPAGDVPENEFRREFVRVLADQIGRHFYDHDRYADYAVDALALD